MKDPLFTPTPPKVKSGKTKAREKKVAVARQPLSANLRIVGGKAIARRVNFVQQRERKEGSDKRKLPTVAPTRRLVVSTGADTANRKSKKITAAPSLAAAFAEKEALVIAPTDTIQRVWRPLGPFCIPHGQTYGAGPGSRPSISGRVSAIAIDPNDPNHILIGSGGGGGVWETKTGGTVWTPRSDDQPSLSIGAIAFDPGKTTVVYAGTGEGDGTLVDDENLLGVGLLRSNDGGETWTLIAGKPFERLGFYDLAVDPRNSDVIYAATTEGLFQSVNGGQDWTRKRRTRTWDLSVHPVNPDSIDSTKETFAACVDGLFRSTNGGNSWSSVKLPSGRKRYERMEVCHAPSDGNVVYVFAATPNPTDSDENPIPHIWRRSVFGGPFARIDKLPDDLDTEQSWYDWFAGVAPNNPDVLYIGGIDAHKGIRSPSGSWQWENISAKKFGTSIHPDMHVIAFTPGNPNAIYIGCDGGIFRSPNGGKNWISLNKGLCLTEVEYLAQHPQFESWLIAGTQDNGTLQYQGNDVWYHISDGDGGDCAVSSTFPYTCYVTFYGMGIARSTRGGGWNTWPPPPDDLIGPPVTSNEDYPNGALFYSPLEVNDRTVVQAGKRVFISTDGGDSWVKVALFLQSEELSSALTMPSPTRIYVGTTDGRMFRLDLSAGNWTRTQLSKAMTGYVSDILVDPTNPNRIFITYQSSDTSSHVFRSDNEGESWNDISAGLPNIAVNAIEIDSAHPNTIFVAADVGIYRSDDAGNSWTLFNPGLPNILVKDLAFHPPSRLLRAGTQARGVWEIPVDEATLPGVEIYLRDNAVDTGRLSPSPFGVYDPFNFGAQTFWWQCVDIKVDSSAAHTPSLDDVDFEIFGDDQSMIGISDGDRDIQFAEGLIPENPIRGQVARVFVRVNNRGINAATNVTVKVFFASLSSIAFPDLPQNFWLNFPNNLVPADSSWQPIASHKVIPTIAAGSSQIVGFEWPVPTNSPNDLALLSIVSAENDAINTNELNIPNLITGNKKCGLRNVTIVNPSPGNGPVLRSVLLNLTGATKAQKSSLVSAQTVPNVLRVVVLSKRLSKLASQRKAKTVKLTSEEKQELARLLEANPSLKNVLDTKAAFVVANGALFEHLKLEGKQEPMVFLVNPKIQSGVASIMQVLEEGTVVGGHTFQAIARG
jgi:photosystem II stability/assembly factor-like uncharacterized protein